MKPFLHIAIALFILIVASCNSAQNKQVKAPEAPVPLVAGGDRDEHGCIGSAGYTWSELRKECIRLFELGSPFTAYGTTKDTTLSAFVVLSDDKLKAEVFLPNGSKPIELNAVYTAEGDIAPVIFENTPEKVAIIFTRDYYYIRSNDELIFVQKYTDKKSLWTMLNK